MRKSFRAKSYAGKTVLAILLVLATLTVLAVVGLLVWKIKHAEKPAAEPPPPVDVTVMNVQPVVELVDRMELPAAVEPNRVVRVAAEVAGRIEEIAAAEGDPIKAGQTLIRLNKDLLQAEYDRAAAQAAYDEGEYKRIKALYEGGGTPERDVADKKARMEISAAALAEIKARLDRAVIHAPVAGLLNKVPVEKGEYVQVGDLLAEIVDRARVKVVADIPERDISFLSVGQPVRVASRTKGQPFERDGVIAYLDAVADPMTRVTRCEVVVDNSDDVFHTGEIVRVALTRRVLRDVIMIPLEAVIPLENGKQVYVVNDGKAHERMIEIGIIQGRRVQVVSGLQPGDALIVEGQRFVGPEQTVKVIEPQALPAADGAAKE